MTQKSNNFWLALKTFFKCAAMRMPRLFTSLLRAIVGCVTGEARINAPVALQSSLRGRIARDSDSTSKRRRRAASQVERARKTRQQGAKDKVQTDDEANASELPRNS